MSDLDIQQMLQQQDQHISALLKEQNREIQELSIQLREINELFQQSHAMVSQQKIEPVIGPMILVEEKIEAANENLDLAYKKRRCTIL